MRARDRADSDRTIVPKDLNNVSTDIPDLQPQRDLDLYATAQNNHDGGGNGGGGGRSSDDGDGGGGLGNGGVTVDLTGT